MKKLLFALLLIALVFTGGCWSRKEVNELIIVTILGIDKVKNPAGKMDTEISIRAFKLAQTAGGGTEQGGGSPPIWVARSRGIDALEAVNNLNTRSPRRIFLAQTDVIVIGEEIAREGLTQVLDFLQRNRETRLRNKFFIAKGSAGDILSSSPEIEAGLGSELRKLAAEAQLMTGKAPDIDLKTFLQQYSTLGIDAIAPKVELISLTRGQGETPPPVVSEEQKKFTTIRVLGAAYFRRNKMAGWLDERETRGVLLARGKFQGGVYVVGHKGEPEAHMGLRVTRAQGGIEAKVEGGKIKVTVKVKAEADLLGQGEAHIISEQESIKELNDRLGKAIEADIKKAWEVSRRARADIFGIGEVLHRSDPKTWRKLEKKWREEWLPLVDLKVETEAEIRRTGMINDPLIVK